MDGTIDMTGFFAWYLHGTCMVPAWYPHLKTHESCGKPPLNDQL